MSKKSHEKQLARARARRAEEHAQQRQQRRVTIAVVVVVLAAAAAVAWWLLSGQQDPVATPSETPTETASESATEDATEATSVAPTATETPSDGSTEAPTDDVTDGSTEAASVAPPATTEPAEAPCPPPTDAPAADTTLQWDQPPQPEVTTTVTATIETTCGTIVAELDGESAPQTVSSFVFLAEEDFYVGTPFHRVMADFVIQGGDPTGTGTGGPGYAFDDELELAEQVVADNDGNYPRGTLAMANSGPNTNGSQFYIVQADPGYPFPPDYTIFGTVTEGMDVVDDIANGPVTGPRNDEAVDPAVILDVTIEETGS